MKRKLCNALVIILCLSLALPACGRNDNQGNEAVNANNTGTIAGTSQPGNTGNGPTNGSSNPNVPEGLTPPEITGVASYPADGIGVAGKDYKELKTGPADDWGDTKIPYFNPLGSKSLYEGGYVTYREAGGINFETLDQYFTNTFKVEGEEWDMKITDPDFKVFWLRAYAKKLGATIYDTPGDTGIFQVYENETSQYWVKAEVSDGWCYLRIVRTDVAPIGKTITYKPDDYDVNTVYFYTDCTKGKLQSVTVTIKGEDNSGVELYCQGDRTYGDYMRLIRKEIDNAEGINTKKTDTFVFDDIPITDGQLQWSINWDSLRGTVKPSEVTFTINDVADISTVKYGEQLGMIRVVGVPLGEVEILPADGAENRHPEFDASYPIGTRDRDGNTVFSVPSGYYNLRFCSSYFPGRNGASLSIEAPAMMRLVPVSAGEITTVTVPRETQLTFDMLKKQFGASESEAGNIEITDNKDNGDTATVSIVINDPLERDVFPEKDDFTITENGLKAVVTDIQREPAPVDVILVLDTSGSMKPNMTAAIDSAKKFVEKLPENTNIRLVQFEQKITQHKATTKEGVITALGTLKAGGGTALYDATDTALKLLEGTKKPYVVLFSDGADSRELKNQGKGSSLTRDKIIQKISASGATVLSIGFGKDHDPRALIAMSNASKNGAYFAAMDPAALDNAFAAVSGKFGNQFTITYQRPTAVKDRDSDVPVVSFMIDRSASMDMSPDESENDVGYRIDKVKSMFHDFILNLPQGTLMQLGSFRTPAMAPDHIIYDEITTDQKAPVLQGLGAFTADGGTPIIPALTAAYDYLSTIPSSKKTLVYFTDAALAGEDETEKAQLEEILTKMNKEGFRILFAGLGNDKFAQLYQDAFSKAAQLSGGDYIITGNIDEIRKKLDDLMNKMNQPKTGDNTLSFTISLNCKVDDGSRMDYGAQNQVKDFSVRETSGQVIKPELVKISAGEKYITYDQKASKLLYGSDRPNQDSSVLEYIPYETGTAAPGSFSGQNKEMKLTVREAYYMDPFKGIYIGNRQRQFLALNVEVSMADGAPIKDYQIPSIFRHFYVSLNDVMSPASEATWLAETPLSEPGDPSVTLSAATKKTGVLVFMVDRDLGQRVDQLSLHFYDTDYGHISIPLAGKINPNLLEISELPKTQPAKLSDTFSLTVDGKSETAEISGVSIYQDTGNDEVKNSTFRVIQGKFQSNVQALLNIDPAQRFLYAIDTNQGPLVTKMNDVVYNMPMGFTGSTMIAPGASVPVRMPFQISSKLAASASYLFADLATGGVNIPVTSGDPYKTGSLGKKWSHEYFDITVNALRRVSENNPRMVVLDFTITDKKDGMGLTDVAGLMDLAKGGPDGQLSEDSAKYFGNNLAVGRSGLGDLNGDFRSDNVIPVNNDTNDLLYGASSDWAVLDGATRRGILLFYLPDNDISAWALNFGAIENLSLPIEKEYYGNPELLAKKQWVDRDDNLDTMLREAVTAAVEKYQSTRTDANPYVTKGLADDEIVGRQSITPAITIHGRQTLENVATPNDFLQVMYGISCIPTGEAYTNTYCPEAVITQGWGTELDLARLAMDMLARLGYQPKILTAGLTSTGMENVGRITGLEPREQVPAIAYTDENGSQKVFVIPFMRDMSELTGLAYLANQNIYDNNFESWKSRMMITVHAKIVERPGGAAQVEAFNSLNSALGGEGESSGDGSVYEDVTLFDKEVSYADMSMDSVDISYSPIGKSADGQHDIITAMVDTKDGILFNDKYYIDTSFYDIESVSVTIYARGSEQSHTTYLKEGQKLSDVFQTFAFNLPGLTQTAAETLQKAVDAKSAAGKDSGDYATVKWIGHAAVNRFVRELTNFEKENMPIFGVKTARLDSNPLILMVTMVSDGSKATATMDIMNHETRVLNDAEKANMDGFSTMQGLYASMLEAYALGGDKAVGFLQVWSQLPKDTPLFVIKDDMMEDFAKSFEENGGPAKLVEHLREQGSTGHKAMFIVPKSPAVIDGKPRYAWLEITEGYYGTHIISVSETGEHSAMAEYIVLNAASFGVKPLSAEGAAGFLVGITCIDWGIATYSLNTENYASIMAQTKIMVTGVYELLATFEGAIDTGSKILNMSPEDYKSMLDALESTYTTIAKQNALNVDVAAIHEAAKNMVLLPTFDANLGQYEKSEFAGSAKGYSFSDGFKAAIEAYFPKAK